MKEKIITKLITMKYTKGVRVLNEENQELRCVVADNETAVFGRILYTKEGKEYTSYELLVAYSNFETSVDSLKLV